MPSLKALLNNGQTVWQKKTCGAFSDGDETLEKSLRETGINEYARGMVLRIGSISQLLGLFSKEEIDLGEITQENFLINTSFDKMGIGIAQSDTWEILSSFLQQKDRFSEIHSQTPMFDHIAHISLGPITIHFYGLMYALGALNAFSSHGGFFKKKKEVISSEAIGDILFWTMLFGVLVEDFSTLLSTIHHTFSKPRGYYCL